MTTEEFRNMKKGKSKQRVADKSERFFNGILFDSKDEMMRYKDLLILERARKIWDLEYQPQFILVEGFATKRQGEIRHVFYTADFKYKISSVDEEHFFGFVQVVVEDVKGFKWSKHKTPRKLAVCSETFRLKRKLFLHKYPEIDFRVVDRDGEELM